MQKKYKILSIFVLVIALFFVTVLPVLAGYGLEATAEAAEIPMGSDLPTLIGRVIGAGLAMIGVVFLILTIYGGLLWMTARGNDEQTKKALNTLIAASIGIVIVVAAYAITNFVFTSVQP